MPLVPNKSGAEKRQQWGLWVFAVIAVSGAAFLFFGRQTDEVRIVETLKKLSELCSFESSSHLIEQAARAKEIAGFFAEKTVILARTTGGERQVAASRAELQKKAIAGQKQLSQLAVRLFDFDVAVSGDAAVVSATGRAMGRMPGREDYFLEEHPLRIELRREDGRWLIVEAENQDLIQLSSHE